MLRLEFLHTFFYKLFFPTFCLLYVYQRVSVLELAFLGMYTWARRLRVSGINHDWSVISTGEVNMFISLTFHHSILAPVFQSSHKIAIARGLEKCVCCQGGMDIVRMASQMCWFCWLFTHFQWLISHESEGTSTTWFLWHCQLLLSPHHCSVMSPFTCLSSVGVRHLFRLCYGLPSSSSSTLECLCMRQMTADADFNGDLDPQLHLLGIYVRGDLSDRGDTVIPP